MWQVLLGLLKGGRGGKTPIGNLAWDIREAIKGKELDPNELISLQTKINEIEAGHRSIFVAGWRPFIGWIGGLALMFEFILSPCIEWYSKFAGLNLTAPEIQTGPLLAIVTSMLGVAGMRSFEKARGLTK